MAKKYQKSRLQKPMQTSDVVPLGGEGYQQKQNVGVAGVETAGTADAPATKRKPVPAHKIKINDHLKHDQLNLKWGW